MGRSAYRRAARARRREQSRGTRARRLRAHRAWSPPNGADGKSFNIYNRVSKRWERSWVDTSGRITHYIGDFKDGNLYYEATQFGSTNKIKMTFENKGPNEVRQFGEHSTDGGKTWTMTFDLTYLRKSKL